MKVLMLTLLFLFNLNCLSQEICNNGIDDDGDGLKDLLDPDCLCNPIATTSLLPNHDFEDYTSCPNGTGQINKASPWDQGTLGKPNYINRCGFVPSNLNNYPADTFLPNDEIEFFPSGDGIAGAIMSSPYNEYIKSTLTTPIPAGTSAQLSLKVAAIIYNNSIGPDDMNISALTPTNLTVYGRSNATNVPFPTFTNPNIPGSPWIEIGSAAYIPKPKWQDVTISFTPSIEISQIMIGAPEVLPESYYVPLMHIGSFPYFLYDDVMLNTLSETDLFITRSGNICNNNMVLTASINANTTGNVVYQWYKDGAPIFLEGNASTFDVSNSLFSNKDGNYVVQVADDTSCYSASFTLNSVIPNPSVQMSPPRCTTAGTINITSIAEEYSINNGITWSTNPFFTPVSSGVYYVVTKNEGCISSPRIVVVPSREQFLPAPFISAIQPNSCADIGQITVNTAVDLYSFDNGITWINENTLQNAPPGVYTVLIQDATGCTSLPLTITLESFTNNSAPPSGDELQYFCITENTTLNEIIVTGLGLKWYDALTGGNLIPSSTAIQNEQTYYASQSVNNCESPTRLAVTTFIIATLNAESYVTTLCDEGNDGNESIDLTDFNLNLTVSTSYIFEYYTSLNGAENQSVNEVIFNTENYQLSVGSEIIYVRISNLGSCFKIVKLTLNLMSPPFININDNIPLCENSTVSVNAGDGFDTYLWSTNETTPAITLTQAGNYSVTVSKANGGVLCTTTKDFTVFISSVAIISEIINSNWNQDSTTVSVVLSAASSGDYQYAIDQSEFQDSNTFIGINGGEHTLFVKDKNGCGIISQVIYLHLFPKYFTPNGDSFNDTWSVKFLKAGDTYQTYIYDRYGKFLKMLTNNESWDGTVSGRPLPATDYWFQIISSDGKTYNSHFSLRR
jgi:gliding motility-associated-like protein